MNKFYKISWFLVYFLFLAFCNVNSEPIVNGDVVQIKHYPYQVYLSTLLLPTCLKDSWLIKLFPCVQRKGLFCGGSIVNKRNVLTAAHCLEKMKINKVEIYAGTNRIDDPNAQVYTPQAFIIHPEYHSSALMFNKTNPKYANLMVNDIALIRLKEDIQFTEVIRPVKLPRSNYHLNEVAVVTGWGNMGYHKPMSKFLRATQQKIISWKSCDRQWQLKYLKYIDKGMMCAITYNHEQASGPCPGDSGGPFVDRDNYQIGIISFGYECGTTHLLPDVYVNVWEYVKWIRNNAKI